MLTTNEMKSEPNILKIRGQCIDYNKKTVIMGILNVTPDSFSDGGRFNHIELAVNHALQLVRDGADIIDIGGESTRPGAAFVSEEVEIDRVIPVIKAIRKRSNVPISIDTYKAETARRAIEAGADIINDVWGAKADPEMAAVAAQYQAYTVLMHNRQDKNYRNIIEDMISDLRESIQLVLEAGLSPSKIIIDPGIGFAKTSEDNLTVMRELESFHKLGYPVLLGTSRKAFIGKVLGTQTDGRMEGTGATVCLGITKGCQMVRVHDVLAISRMAKMMDAMLKGSE